MAQSGRNLTPPDLRMAERRPLNDICDRAFCDIVKLLDVKIIIGVGKFAQERAKAALRNSGMLDVKVECIMHPSPANPTANKGWQPIVERQLREMGVIPILVPDKPNDVTNGHKPQQAIKDVTPESHSTQSDGPTPDTKDKVEQNHESPPITTNEGTPLEAPLPLDKSPLEIQKDISKNTIATEASASHT